MAPSKTWQPKTWEQETAHHTTAARHRGGPRRLSAFSLVELLTVIFIISLLIGILIPSLGAARSAAKKTKTGSDLKSISVALDLFRGDNERDFPLTNGYPPSFAHPPISRNYVFEPWNGQFPFYELAQSNPPRVYGAHWLATMLLGADLNGYVKKSTVPPDLRDEPWRWYADNPPGSGDLLPRVNPLYMEPGSIKTIETRFVRGRAPEDIDTLFPNWEEMKTLPVLVDAFEQPILYYAANKYGKEKNMLEDFHEQTNQYIGGVQREGIPIYFHQDNMGFTGLEDSVGWDFGGGEHKIARPGHEIGADEILLEENRNTFARFILNRTVVQSLQTKEEQGIDVLPAAPLKPANPDSYLLISAGADGVYGTTDDVTNFPLRAD